MRKEVWKFLLGYLPFNATEEERMGVRKEREGLYYVVKAQWMSFLPEQEAQFSRWSNLKHLISESAPGVNTGVHVRVVHVFAPGTPHVLF